MKLSDLISGLADEIEIIRPELALHLEELTSLEVDDEDFIKAAGFYSEQVERMGEAADMVGFPGLVEVCLHVKENIDSLKQTPKSARDEYISFLERWPDFTVLYLKNIDDSSCAAGLVDFLKAAPQPIDDSSALKIMHSLGAFPEAMDSMEMGEHSQRPVLATPSDASLNIPDDVEPNLLDGFYQEAPQQTERLVFLLTNLLAGKGNLDEIIEAKRIVHTIKGTASIIGILGLTNIGHHFEDVLDYFESKEGHVNKEVATVLLDGAHCLAQMIAYLTGSDEHPNQALSVLQNILDIANIIDKGGDLNQIHLRDSTSVVSQAPVASVSQVSNKPNVISAIRVSMNRIEELFRVSAEMSVQTSAMETQIKDLMVYSKRLHSHQLRVKKRLFELETVVDVHSLALMNEKGRSGQDGENFDPLELEQYNELHSTTHALLEEFNDVVLLGNQLTHSLSGLQAQENQQQVLSRDLQHLIIGTRMSEVGSLESRLQRNIRTTCQMTDKQARLIFKGGETLIDSDVLNQLADPLLHLLRNAVDHGIEKPDVRERLGKDPIGTISLEFIPQGQQIFLHCQDDGKGLDYERILQRAIENKLITDAESLQLSEGEIGLLIFNSGFSTKESVSQVSGRGVGMDVVRDWVSKMNGNIQVSSVIGQSTKLTLNFASSLTTVQSLLVEVSSQVFALPSVQVQQALSNDEGKFVDHDDILTFHYNNTVYGAKHLSDLLGFERSGASLDQCFSVLLRVDGDLWAIAVDKLIDSKELLLKPPGLYVKNLDGIVGTSILGDGSIAIHLDMPQFIAKSEGKSMRVDKHTVKSTATDLNISTNNVLVVDDSLSVRNTLQQLVEDAGYIVKTARDGIEAVNLLGEFNPQVVLTDLEMPNMNGVELTEHIRSREGLENLPIIMITSRSQDKHREMAVKAGVNQYFTKPYNDVELLSSINHAVNR